MITDFYNNVKKEIEATHMNPIYEICMVDCKDPYPHYIGFYYSPEDASYDLHMNNCDMRECCFDEAFVLARFPGPYQTVDKGFRVYFKWDENKEGFFEAEEPDIYEHLSF